LKANAILFGPSFRHTLDSQWTSLTANGSFRLSWSDFRFAVNPSGRRDQRRRERRERRRWTHADEDHDGDLDKEEFK